MGLVEKKKKKEIKMILIINLKNLNKIKLNYFIIYIIIKSFYSIIYKYMFIIKNYIIILI